MKRLTRLTALSGAVVGLSMLAIPAAGASETHSGTYSGSDYPSGARNAVFVQTDNTAGNQVVAYERAGDGSLTLAHAYDTDGLGGVLNGSAVDHLASQGSLVYERDNGLLFAVNAGSNTVSVFSVNGDKLVLHQVVSSGGQFPVSVAVHGNYVYVLNAEGGGSVQGYVALAGQLWALPGSHRSLGLTIPTDTTQFTHTPGQVTFTPDGSKLIVTTKANGNDIDVYGVGRSGLLSASPVVNVEAGTVPFGVSFDAEAHLVVANAGNNSVATYALSSSGVVNLISSVATGQAATCWVAPARGYFFASNAGSPSVSGVSDATDGQLTLLTPPITTDPGTVDASASIGGRYLYVQTGGNGIVDEFAVNSDGSLTKLGSVTVPDAVGGEGIRAF